MSCSKRKVYDGIVKTNCWYRIVENEHLQEDEVNEKSVQDRILLKICWNLLRQIIKNVLVITQWWRQNRWSRIIQNEMKQKKLLTTERWKQIVQNEIFMKTICSQNSWRQFFEEEIHLEFHLLSIPGAQL